MRIDRRVRIAIVAASLLLNVFLVGIVAGHLFSSRDRGGPKQIGPVVPGANVRALPDDERRRFATAMRGHRDAMRAARQAHRTARQAVEAAIAAPGFERDKVDAAFATLRQTNTAVQEATHAALLDALQDLSPQSRAALVQHDAPAVKH